MSIGLLDAFRLMLLAPLAIFLIEWALVCRLHHKTNGGRSAWDTRRDLVACFTWKQVWIGFPSLA
jgi:hypothetical protein